MVTLVQNGGLALAVVVLVFGGVKGWYHWGPEVEDIKKDRDDWKTIALRGTHLAERALESPPPPK